MCGGYNQVHKWLHPNIDPDMPSRASGHRTEARPPSTDPFPRSPKALTLSTLDFIGSSTLEATQGQILSQSPRDSTRFWWHLYGSWLKKSLICPWLASRVTVGNVAYMLDSSLKQPLPPLLHTVTSLMATVQASLGTRTELEMAWVRQ